MQPKTKWILRITTALILSIIAVGALVTHTMQSQAGVPTSILPNVSGKISNKVLEDTANGKSTSFVIYMTSQADVSAAYGMKDEDARGWYVYNTLRKEAETSQAPIRDLLASRGITYKSFWVANMIIATGDRTVLNTLAERSDIRVIESDATSKWITDPAADASPVVDSPLVPEAIENGVSNVRAPQLWALGFTGQGIVIANQDTGMRWTYSAIKAHYRGWDGLVADHNYNWYDSIHAQLPGSPAVNSCGYNTVAPCDDQGHGTHTTGTTNGDDGNPGTNQIGVAPGAKWIGCRNMDAGNGRPYSYSECFQFFLAPTDVAGNNPNPALRPHVMNNSWGCPVSEECAANAFQTIVENSQASGIFVVVSAGNDGSGCSTVSTPPAIYSAAFTVGAINGPTNALTSFSSRGPVTFDGSGRMKPELSAPGNAVRSSLRTNDTAYGNMNGTSMAGPHVVGVVALLWSARPGLNRAITETKQLLMSTANPDVTVPNNGAGCGGSNFIPNNHFGWGRIDALAAYNASGGGGGPFPTPTITNTPTETPTSTNTSTVTNTPTPTNTRTVTNTPVPTNTRTATRTFTVTNTPTSTVTATATPTCVAGYSVAVPWATVVPRAIDTYGSGGAGTATDFYVGSGYSYSTLSYTSQFARYNPSSDTWTMLTSMTGPGEGIGWAYAPINNKIYAMGGVNCGFGLPMFMNRIYDVTTGTWSTGANMPYALHGAAVAYFNGKIYVAGGFTNCAVSPVNTLYIYDVMANTWTTGAGMPALVGGAASGVINGRIYVAGGRDTVNSNRTALLEYNPTTNTWATKAAMPSGVNAAAGATFGNTLWVMGGGTPLFRGESSSPINAKGKSAGPDAVNSTQIYNQDTNTWSAGPPLTVSRSFLAGGAVGTYAVAVGGFDGSTTLAVTERASVGGVCLDPSATPTATFTPQPTATATASPTCAPAPAGWLSGANFPTNILRYGFAQVGNNSYVFGGVITGTQSIQVYMYDSVANTWTRKTDMPFTSEAPACAYMASNNKVYCAQGDTGNGFGIYDVATNSWSNGPVVPGGDHYGAAAGAFNGKVYIVGGGMAGASTGVRVYDTTSGLWSTGTSIPQPYELGGYTQGGQYLYLVGSIGLTPSGAGESLASNARANHRALAPNANSTSTFRLDLTTGTWSTGPVWTPGRSDMAVAYDPIQSKLYAIGGDAPGGTYFDSTNLVDELYLGGWPTGSWTASTPLPTQARQGNQAGFFTTGRAGGEIWSTGGADLTAFAYLNANIYRVNGFPCATSTPTSTFTATATNTATETPTPTRTPTNTPSNTPTNTPTNIPNTATQTNTRTATVTPTATCVVNANYGVTVNSPEIIVPGTNLVAGSQCAACVVTVNLPFTYNYYDMPFTSVNVSNKGNLQFSSSSTANGSCIPTASASYVIAPYWGDFTTNAMPVLGVYTSVTGTAPNRIYNIEWRVRRSSSASLTATNFEVLLYEGQPRFDVIYGNLGDNGVNESIGAQESTGIGFRSVQYSCNTVSVHAGDRLRFDRRACLTGVTR